MARPEKIDEILSGFYYVFDNRSEFEICAREMKDCVIEKYDPRTVAGMFHTLYRSLLETKP